MELINGGPSKYGLTFTSPKDGGLGVELNHPRAIIVIALRSTDRGNLSLRATVEVKP